MATALCSQACSLIAMCCFLVSALCSQCVLDFLSFFASSLKRVRGINAARHRVLRVAHPCPGIEFIIVNQSQVRDRNRAR